MSEEDEWRAIGERLRRTRLIAGMSQADLGKKVGLDRTMVAKIEAGTRRIGALELTQISDALDVPIGYLLEPLPQVLSRRGSVVDEDFESQIAQESGRLEIVLATWLGDLRQLIELGTLRVQSLLVSKQPTDSEASARDVALWVRELLGCQIDPIESLVELCERAGQFVLVTEVPGEAVVTAITDDRKAAKVARFYGLDVHGTVWLLAGACREGKLTPQAAGSLIDALRATGHRLPCTGAGFPRYAHQHGLL